jgi:thiol-disulfide isomerase/thioredoxin
LKLQKSIIYNSNLQAELKMKLTFILLSGLLFLFGSNISAQTFTIKPEKPKPGDKIEVKFDPTGTSLDNAEDVELFAYLYNKDLRETKSSKMVKKGKVLTSSFTTGKEDLGVVVIFKKDEIYENNNKKGYVIYLYDKKGNILPGSKAGLGNGYFTWMSYYLGFDRNPQLAMELMSADFEKNPSLKKEYVKYYVPVFSTMQKENASEIIREGASLLEQKKDLTEDDYSTLIGFYQRLKDEENKEKFEKAVLQKFPSGSFAQMKEAEGINIITDTEARASTIREFGKKYPESRYLQGMHNQLIKTLVGLKEYDKLKNFLVTNKDQVHPYYYSNTAGILSQDSSFANALEIAAAGEDAAAIKIKKEKKPEYLSESQWKESQNELIAQILFAKGKTLYMMDRKSEALDVLQKAAKETNFKDAEINLFYAKSLMDEGQYDETFDQVSKFIREGNSTDEMIPLLEESYKKVKGNSNGFNVFLSTLEKEASLKIAEKLKHEMINEPAPSFKLVDLDGKEVSLADYKGKVVLVDFWATWCGPCLSSFPGLQKAVEKYKDNENVKFLFVNSWERVENKKQNAVDFISKNNYPFHVLLDLDNKVIESFKVSGIPTKFIIDKNGNIRFKSVGYSGNNDQMVSELKAMISMLE